jgi:hypothetical protein
MHSFKHNCLLIAATHCLQRNDLPSLALPNRPKIWFNLNIYKVISFNQLDRGVKTIFGLAKKNLASAIAVAFFSETPFEEAVFGKPVVLFAIQLCQKSFCIL